MVILIAPLDLSMWFADSTHQLRDYGHRVSYVMLTPRMKDRIY